MYVSRRQRRGALMGADAGSDWVSTRLTRVSHPRFYPPPPSPSWPWSWASYSAGTIFLI